MNPEEMARQNIDRQLSATGWIVQDLHALNLHAGRGIAVREFPLTTGEADYLLFVDKKAVGVVEAKPEGATLSGVADQAGKYAIGLPPNVPHVSLPLPFQYESTGVETLFRDNRDPQPKSRRVFTFHRPETLAEWAAEADTLRGRLQDFPPLIPTGLWPAQIAAVENLERSLRLDRPRALIQMATGAGKTVTAVSFLYRLIKHGRARRILFLVDRSNLAKQALKEFQGYTTPDDGRKLGELYNVSRLTSNAVDPVNKVVITTIQRLYSILSGEPEFDPANEDGSLFESAPDPQTRREVHYNPNLPVEFFDVIVTDECHRSIYNLWRGVLEYFDAFIIGLTATPSKQTLGFFNQNLVMEYSRRQAVADGVNVDGEVYRIRTRIGEQGNTLAAGEWVGKRDKLTRREHQELLDQDFSYDPEALDRQVAAPDQIRTVLETFRDQLFTKNGLFPGRKDVPKTLVFAKDDSHAEDIVGIAKDVFGKGDEFCKKITYRVTGIDPEQLIKDFRNQYHPRIAVTVDMVATGTDIKPIEALIFMRAVRSRILFEQMLGRGTRVISPTDLEAVTPGGYHKDRFVIVDAVGIVDQEKVDTGTLERKKSTPFDKLLGLAAVGAVDEAAASSLAGRLIRLKKRLSPADCRQIESLSPACGLDEIIAGLLQAVDPDRQLEAAQTAAGISEVTPEQVEAAAQALLEAAVIPLAANPPLREALIEINRRSEMVIDPTPDVQVYAGWDEAGTENARQTVESFEAYLQAHRDEITALQIIFNLPAEKAGLRLTLDAAKELAQVLEQPPQSWTTEGLWRAYAALERDRVRGANEKRTWADVVALVRHAIHLDDELVPYPEQVQQRYAEWLEAQAAAGRQFSAAQRWWLDRIAAQIGVNLALRVEDLNQGEFFQRGGVFGAKRVFGEQVEKVVDELNEVLGG